MLSVFRGEKCDTSLSHYQELMALLWAARKACKKTDKTTGNNCDSVPRELLAQLYLLISWSVKSVLLHETRKPKWKYQSETGEERHLREENRKRDWVKRRQRRKILPIRPSSLCTWNTEKRYSERQRDRMLLVCRWNTTGHRSL